jgi:hypothetical protein
MTQISFQGMLFNVWSLDPFITSWQQDENLHYNMNKGTEVLLTGYQEESIHEID